MAVAINTYSAALNARRYLERSEASLATSLQRLSSGIRINSARDDAAGLSISERMSSQVRGANQAVRNANDAISLFQTLDGVAGEMSGSLQRIRELAVQAANSTNSLSDRLALNREVQQSLSEFDRAATAAAFNGKKLATGVLGMVPFQLGANPGDSLSVDLGVNLRQPAVGALETLVSADLRVVGAFVFAGTYTTVPLGSLNFSILPAVFAGGAATTAGTPATDYSAGQSAVFTVDGATVTLNANYASLEGVRSAVQAQLNTAHGGWYGVSNSGGRLTITKTASASSPTAAVAVGFVSGANAVAFSDSTQTAGTAAATATKAGFQVDGHAVAITADYSGNVAGLMADIQAQLDAATAGSGGYTVAGSDSGISIVGAGGVVKPVVGGFTGTGAVVFAPAAAATLPLVAGDFSVQVGDGAALAITGHFPTPESLTAAISARVPGVFAAINSTTGALELTSAEPLVVSGAYADPGGLFGFTSLTSVASGSLLDVNVLESRTASTTLQRVDAALKSVNAARATFGAVQNRLTSIIANLHLGADQAAVARSRILDADYATEAASLTRSQMLQLAGVAVVTQANLDPQMVLSLLR